MSDAFEPRTAVTILLDRAAPEIAAARYELDPRAWGRIELHFTLLYPFVPRGDVSPALLTELESFFAGRPRPEFALARVAVFEGTFAYAAPEPDDELAATMRDLWARYPDTPPYGGEFTEPVPHATIAPLAEVDLETVRARVDSLLPVDCSPEHASLLEEFEPDCWRELHPLAFGAAL